MGIHLEFDKQIEENLKSIDNYALLATQKYR